MPDTTSDTNAVDILDRMFASSPIPTVVFERSGLFVHCNTALANLVGYSIGEFASHPSLIYWIERVIDDEHMRKDAISAFTSIQNNGTTTGEFASVIRCKNGRHINVDFLVYNYHHKGQPTEHIILLIFDTTEIKTTEFALREIEGRYSALFYRSLDLVLIHDFNGCFIDANPALIRLLGFRRTEIGDLRLSDIMDRDQHSQAQRIIEDIRHHGQQQELVEYTFRNRNGKQFNIQMNGILMHRDSRPYAILAIGRDITSLKKNEEDRKKYVTNLDFLAKSAMQLVQISSDGNIYDIIASRLHSLTVPGIIAVHSFDKNTMTLTTNEIRGIENNMDAVVRLWGTNPIGKTYKINSSVHNLLLDGKLNKISSLFEMALEEIPKNVCSTLEAILDIRDCYSIGFSCNNILYGAATFLTYSTPPNIDTELIETFARQISVALERWQSERALRRSEEKYHHLMDSINDIIYSTNEKGIITFIGPQISRYGIDPDAMIGKPFTDIILHDDGDRFILDLKHIISTGKGRTSEFRITDSNGAVHWLEDNSMPQMNKNRSTIGITGILRDITRRVEIENALKVSESELRLQKEKLEQKTIALKEIIDQIEIEKNTIKQDVITNVEKVILPILKKLRLSKNPHEHIDVLHHMLEKISSSFGHKLTTSTAGLTPREIEICTMIESGLRNKEIANLLNLTCHTIENHRKSIRRKFEIQNKHVNLTSFLKQM